MKHSIAWLLAFIFCALFWLAVLLAATKAHAQGCPCGATRVWTGFDHVWRCYRCPQRVYGWRSDDDEDRGRGCRDTRTAVGDQHLTPEGAKKAANDAWAAAVRFHLGEKYMSLDNARHLIYTCSRSSIKEPSVTTLGQQLTRCELRAQPCAPLPDVERRD